VVWPAEDRATGRAVAAKVLHPELLDDPDALQRLQAEAEIAGRLRHPHVVEVLGLWSDAGLRPGGASWVLVSERVDGVSLDTVGPLAPEAVVALGLELCGALRAAAEIGLVHGDVRPGNVLVGASGARLFDFGLGRLSSERSPLRPGETAPERLDGGEVSQASDVYGLGVVLHRALHGRLPFGGETAWAVIGAQHSPLGELDGPRGLGTVIRAMLDPDPVDRPDLAMVEDALRRLRSRPDRAITVRRPIPPFRLGATWVVYGTDPRTGTPAIVRAGLSRAAAVVLLKRLRAEGWQVRGIRESFGVRDLLWVGAFTALGGVVIPVVGAIPALLVARRWRARSTRPNLRQTLPALSIELPPKPRRPTRWPAVLAGALLLLTAISLAWWPLAALVPALLLLALVGWSARGALPEAADLARQGRVRSALAELRAAVDTRRLAVDELLAITGEAELLEGEWSAGRMDAEGVLVRVDDLLSRARSAPHVDLPNPTLDALRRTRGA
jgi:hypothetical protein